MKNRKCCVFIAVALTICMLCSGCSMVGADVENQLIPPQNDVEQNAMQTALNMQLQTQNFVLTYPTGGEYRTPFVVLNQIKKNDVIDSDSATSDLLDGWGLVFYRYTVGNSKTRIHLMKKDEKKVWNTVADVEGIGAEIADVNFADLTGDGFPELLLGWALYGTSEKRLTIYRLDRQLETVTFNLTYVSLMAGDLTGDNAEDLVLMNVGGAGAPVKADLFTLHDRDLRWRGTTTLDKGVHQVFHYILAPLSPTVNGLYLDCKKDADTMVTELVYWNGTSLESPLSNDDTQVNVQTVRKGELFSRDVDGDGAAEWPVSREDGLTDWMSYDLRSGACLTKFSSVVNARNKYLVRLRPEWSNQDNVTIEYKTDEQVLCFMDQEEHCFLEIMTVTSGQKIDLPSGYRYITEKKDVRHAVRVDPNIVTLEEAQYLFIEL